MTPAFATASSLGRARGWNGDHVAVDPDLGLLVLSDGGGLTPTEADAAHLAVEVVRRHVREGLLAEPAASQHPRILGTAVAAAHVALVEAQHQDPTAGALGATLVAGLVRPGIATLAHVGNTRAYLLGRRGLRQVTRDHTWAGERLAHGLATAQEVRAHPFRGVITQFLGGQPAPEVEVQVVELLASERLLLCTDGLWEGLSDFQLWELGTRAGDPQEALRALLARSLDQCGEDDASAVLCQGLGQSHATGDLGVSHPVLQR